MDDSRLNRRFTASLKTPKAILNNFLSESIVEEASKIKVANMVSAHEASLRAAK